MTAPGVTQPIGAATVLGVLAEQDLIAALRRRESAAFAQLVDTHTASMVRVARMYVSTDAVAEEVVQETWIALLQGIDKFEGRATLRTWLFKVLVNIAKRRGVADQRSALAEQEATGPTVDPSRFRPGWTIFPGHWSKPFAAWPDSPEGRVLGAEALDVARRELERLPDRQRAVVAMRDVLGLDAAQVCEVLDISQENQRVLLHRGRAKVRQGLADYFERGTQ